MTKQRYRVLWTKEFVSGNLKGLFFDSSLDFFSLDDASRFVAFLHEHKSEPVDAYDSSNYICHMARVVPVEGYRHG